MRRNLILLLTMTWITATQWLRPVQAQDGSGGMPGAFLFEGVGTRALAMGGAYTAAANDLTAIYWNPAGLATANPFQISYTHATLFVDTAIDFMAFSAPSIRYGSFGVAALSVSSGEFEERDALNQLLGSFDSRDFAFFVSWAKELFGRFAVGLNYKMVSQRIMNFNGRGHGVDLGLKADLLGFQAGLAMRNLIEPTVKLSSDQQRYPRQLAVGLAKSLMNDQVLLSAEVSKIEGWGKTDLNLGGEFRFVNGLALRAGISQESITVGAGLSFGKLGLGYGNAGNSDLGLTHRFSVDYSFAGLGVSAEATPKIFSPTGEINISRISLKVKSRTRLKHWRFAIRDQRNRIIREFEAEGQPPEEIVWDGRDKSGSLAADGLFTYVFRAKTTRGHALESEGPLVEVNSRGPQGVIASEGDEK